MHPDPETVIQDTRRWLEKAVVGLNLCPFAQAVYGRGQIHFAVSAATGPGALGDDLVAELAQLNTIDPKLRDTTLLIAPYCLHEFLDFNQYIGQAEALLTGLGLEGEIQIASFHPAYQFAGSQADHVGNCTNRSPYPTLHLLREASIERAVQAYPDTDTIYERNIAVLETLGMAGWNALGVAATGRP